MAQPFLHELVSCVNAPTVALSGTDGQIRPGGIQGALRHDRRVLSELLVDVDGHEPVPVGHQLQTAGTARFVGVVRHLGDPGADPTVRLERDRDVRVDGVDERVTLVNSARVPIQAVVRVQVAVDLAAMNAVRHGEPQPPLAPTAWSADTATWVGAGAHVSVRSSLDGTPDPVVDASGRVAWSWPVVVPSHATWSVTISVTATAETSVASADPASPAGSNPTDTEPATASNAFLPAEPGALGWDTVAVEGPAVLRDLVDRSVGDLAALALADPRDRRDVFLAAGSPWYFTLFGRDSLWAARFTLPLGTDLARGTLRTLARRQGTRYDRETAEAPGKILHEVRQEQVDAGGRPGLPPVYFGTVDATALWVCLLHDAWRWGMAPSDVAALLDPLEAALRWLRTDADPDGDGFLEYIDDTGRGLANQGWKDSGDSIQFPDGAIAVPPIALCEAQAYAYEAAISGAALLDAFDRPGGADARAWAEALSERFRATFWVSDDRGRFPALALDGAKTPVATATSNLGHLLGTGLLDADEAAAVAARLGQDDLDCGHGLRTMSADAAGFNPIGYHAGTIWPPDTAIAVLGLARDGYPEVAASLAAGLVRVAPDFGYRIPELFAGTDARRGDAVLAYPAACRPQAWSAAASIALVQAALGLTADVPAGVLRVTPSPAFSTWFPLRVRGLRVAGHPLTIDVDATGKVAVDTTARLTVESTALNVEGGVS